MSLIVVAILALSACKNEVKKDEATVNSEVTAKTTSIQKSGEFADIIKGYLVLKNGLIADDQKVTAEGGKVLLTAFNNFDMSKIKEKQHKEYMEILENAKEQAEHIIKSPIGHQREHFETLSKDMIDMIAITGTSTALYQQYCPMYNNNTGGTWLSANKEINNPYFGSKMLHCGTVQKQL